MKIGNFDLNKDILIIAEIGNNHEGNFDLAKEMINQAKSAGAHAVKFQRVRAEHLIDLNNKQRFQQIKSYEFTDNQFEELHDHANNLGLMFLCTPFDLSGVSALNKLVSAFKIASSDNNFYPLIESIANTGKPIIMSSGLADYKQIKKAKDLIEKIWRKNKVNQELAILHCVSSYPTPIEESNLSSITALKKKFKCTIGYSDHTLGIEAAVTAVALGARIIEKHFTIDKNLSSFRDHQLSADPKEFTELVRRIKETSLMLGNEKKEIQDSEKNNIKAIRRSIVANKDLPAGKVLKFEDLDWIRLAGGLLPGQEKSIIGKKLSKSIKRGELLTSNIFKRS
ncbi:MAG: N-acetylneuraminate synthase family protein [Candidatus Margulisbacteria bacterium]|nr:N-acetylneuraminate synthase family protein [Candidatus Margulisiibacteriota bacterium]